MAPSSHPSEEHPPEHHQIKRTLWQRWMDWSGSFLVVSILVHLILLGGATVLVVQVVQGKKEKLKFTAPPPSAAGPTEYKVKPSKKTAAAAPAISKRITSTAANVSVALPAMDLNSSSTGPDLMASVMSGMGASGLGSGAGAAGMASMPLAGMTAFGFKGMSGVAGLTGYLYDLKQDKDHNPTNIKADGFFANEHLFDEWDKKNPPRVSAHWWDPRQAIIEDKSPYGKRDDLITKSVQNEGKFLTDYFNNNWDESMLNHYYRSQEPLTSFQFFIPWTTSALKDFGVEKEVKPTHFLIHYKGYVKAPKDGEFRFRVATGSGCTVAIRYDGMNVFGPPKGLYFDCNTFDFTKTPGFSEAGGAPGWTGRWFPVQAGKRVPMEVFLKNGEGGMYALVYIEERHPAQPYRKTLISELYPQCRRVQGIAYPVFSLRKGVPLPPRTTKEQIAASKPQPEKPDDPGWWMYSLDYLDPLIFQGCK